jgi:hypothetical protein
MFMLLILISMYYIIVIPSVFIPDMFEPYNVNIVFINFIFLHAWTLEFKLGKYENSGGMREWWGCKKNKFIGLWFYICYK